MAIGRWAESSSSRAPASERVRSNIGAKKEEVSTVSAKKCTRTLSKFPPYSRKKRPAMVQSFSQEQGLSHNQMHEPKRMIRGMPGARPLVAHGRWHVPDYGAIRLNSIEFESDADTVHRLHN